MILEYKGKRPQIGDNVFIAPTAVIIGDVKIGNGAGVWYGTVLRGDMDPIEIGDNTNIQDNCIVHTDYGYPAIVGSNVTVGHNAVVHGCKVEDWCLIGISSTVLNGAWVKTGSVVAAGSVVREGQSVGPYQLVAGIPAVLKRELDQTIRQSIGKTVNNYLDLSRGHRQDIKACRFD